MNDVLFSKDMTVLYWYPAKKDLKSYTIPFGVVSIEPYAFHKCFNLFSITIPHSVQTINNYAFSDSINLISIVIPPSVISICKGPFYHCTYLISIIHYQHILNPWGNALQQNANLYLMWNFPQVSNLFRHLHSMNVVI